jgi:hypothetical protein
MAVVIFRYYRARRRGGKAVRFEQVHSTRKPGEMARRHGRSFRASPFRATTGRDGAEAWPFVSSKSIPRDNRARRRWGKFVCGNRALLRIIIWWIEWYEADVYYEEVVMKVISLFAILNEAPISEKPRFQTTFKRLLSDRGLITPRDWQSHKNQANDLAIEVFNIADDIVKYNPKIIDDG